MATNTIINGTYLSKNFSDYIVESDGSVWMRIVHHNNPATKLFNSSDTFSSSVYIDQDRWFNASICNKFTSWELMIIQQVDLNGTVYKYRWIQSVNPMSAVFADVASANITKNTTTGYTSFSHGGLYHFGGNTYLCTNNGNNGNWWGAVGAWNNHGGGIPAWNGQIPKTGFVDLYIRVDNQTRVEIQSNMVSAVAFIEK